MREAELTAFTAVELSSRPVKMTGGLHQLRAIHGRLFRDVYDWAGELRTVDMRKGDDPRAEFFMPVSRIESGAGFAFRELIEDKMLIGLDPDMFVRKLSHHYDQVNYLHPFREGNGRTQRIFWSQTARKAGYELDWRRTTGNEVNQASRDAREQENLDGIRSIFAAITTQCRNKSVQTRFPELRNMKLDRYGLDDTAKQTPTENNDYGL